jgi:hypothetical protein
MRLTSAARAELAEIAERDGVVHPRRVVDRATAEDSALHAYFEWDDSKAGAEYRVWQARQVLRVAVVVMPSLNVETPVRAFVSLTPDRYGGGGYRTIAAISESSELTDRMLFDALQDMRRFRARYQRVQKLAAVIAAMTEAEEEIKADSGPKRATR